MRLLICTLVMLTSTGAKADPEWLCLAETMFSEAGAEPEYGKIDVGHTVKVRQRKLHKPICWITKHGYTRRHIPVAVKEYYHALAHRVLAGDYQSPIGDRDSFDSSRRKRHKAGAIRRGGHYFYEVLK